MFNIPNILSVLRIITAVFIPFTHGNHLLLFTLIIFCGITDFLDGYLARKLEQESELGSRLDSLGDFILSISITLYFLIWEWDSIYGYLYWIAAIIIIRFSSAVVCYLKNKKIYSIHTLANKFTGVIVFFGICIIILTGEFWIFLPLLLLSLLSALEELLIMIFIKSPEVNLKSICHALSNKTKN